MLSNKMTLFPGTWAAARKCGVSALALFKKNPKRVRCGRGGGWMVLRYGRGGFWRGGFAVVADDAGGLPGFGEGLARCGFAEAEDEAVHIGEKSSATSQNRRRRAAVAAIKIETARAALRFA